MKAINTLKSKNYYIILKENEIELLGDQAINCTVFLYDYFHIEGQRELQLSVLDSKEFREKMKKRKIEKRVYILVDEYQETVFIFLDRKWFNKNCRRFQEVRDIELNYNDKFDKVIFTKNPLTLNIISNSNESWPLKTY